MTKKKLATMAAGATAGVLGGMKLHTMLGPKLQPVVSKLPAVIAVPVAAYALPFAFGMAGAVAGLLGSSKLG